jgi:hypothetical protein
MMHMMIYEDILYALHNHPPLASFNDALLLTLYENK